MAFPNWKRRAKDHWKEFQPKLYASLEKSGKLEAALEDAAERTYREMTELEDQGFDHQDAWEMVRERYLFLPEEGMKPTAYSESYFNRSPLTTVLHEAIANGARTTDIPRPLIAVGSMTTDQRPGIAHEKTATRVDHEFRGPIRPRTEPIVNVMSSAPLDPPRGRRHSKQRGLVLFVIWIVISVPLVDLGWIGAMAAVFMACLLVYIEHIQREIDREASTPRLEP